MKSERFLSLTLAACAVTLAMTTAAFAGDDDFEFADGLSRRGYTDLAREVFQNLLSDPKSSPQRKAEGQYGLAILAHGEARLEAASRNDKFRKPMADVQKLFDLADQVFEKFVQDNPNHPRALEAKLSRAKLLQDKADYIATCIEQGWLPATMTAQQARQQAAGWFDTAIGLLEENRKKALAELSAAPDETTAKEDARDNLGVVWLHKFAAMLGKGTSLEKGDPAGTKVLEELSAEYMEDFLWEFSGTIRELWGTKMVGQAKAYLGKTDDAVKLLRAAAGAENDPETAGIVQDVTFQAFAEIGRTCLDAGRKDGQDWVRQALNDFDKMAKKWPAYLKHPDGQRAGLVWARALSQSGQAERAMAVVQDVMRNAQGGPVQADAARVLGDLIGKGGSVAAGDPKLLDRVAQQKFNERDFRGAVLAYQSVIASCKTPELMDDLGWKAWERIGDSYYQNGRFWESYLALDRIEQAFKKDSNNVSLIEITNETGFKRAFALDKVATQTKDPADKAAAKKAVEEFAVDHPGSVHSQNAEVANAENKYKLAVGLRSGDAEAYKAALNEAVTVLSAVKPTEKSIDVIQMRIADCRARLGDFPAAIAAADKYVAEKKPDSTDGNVMRYRTQARSLAMALLLGARNDVAASLDRAGKSEEAKKAYQELLDQLTKHEDEFKRSIQGGDRNIDNWRAEGLIGAGQVDKADEMVDRILTTSPDNPNLPYLMSKVAAALEVVAGEFRKKGGEREYATYMLRCAKRRLWALDHVPEGKRSPESVRTVASNFADGEDYASADKLYQEAKKTFEDMAAQPEIASDKKKVSDLQGLARACTIELIGLRVRQGKFDEAIPQLEEELVRDPAARATVLARLKLNTNLTGGPKGEVATIVPKLDATRSLIDQLTGAYMKVPSKERLTSAINLCYIATYTSTGDDVHSAPYIDLKLRQAEAYLKLFSFTKNPDDGKWARAIVRNEIIVPGYLESYDKTLPGAKLRTEKLTRELDQLGIK